MTQREREENRKRTEKCSEWERVGEERQRAGSTERERQTIKEREEREKNFE